MRTAPPLLTVLGAGEPYGMLIARIGDGAPFAVGQFLDFVAPQAGHLFLGANDNYPYYSDNAGEYHVTITIR